MLHHVLNILLEVSRLDLNEVILIRDDEKISIKNPEFISNATRCNFSVRNSQLKDDYRSYYLIEDGELRTDSIEFSYNNPYKELNLNEKFLTREDRKYVANLRSAYISEEIIPCHHSMNELVSLLIEEVVSSGEATALRKVKKEYQADLPTNDNISAEYKKNYGQGSKSILKEVDFLSYEIVKPKAKYLSTPLDLKKLYKNLEAVDNRLSELRRRLTSFRFNSRALTYIMDSVMTETTDSWTPLAPLPRSKKKKYQELTLSDGTVLRRIEWRENILE